MRREVIPNGSYAEALPSEAFGVVVPGGVQTHLGFLATPDTPLFLRVTDVPTFQMAGQAHNSGRVLHYVDGSGWTLRADLSHGQSGHIFDRNGVLHVINPAPNQTSQGYRFVSATNTLVLGDHTYHSVSLNVFEWTQHGDTVIGQGAQGGCIAIRGADRRVLEPGDCRFVRFNRQDDQLAVAIVKLPEGKTVLLWLTVAELAQFPVEEPRTPDPVPAPPQPPEPTPMPQQMPMTAWHVITAMHHKFSAGLPTTEDGARAFTQMCLEQLQFDDPMGGWVWKKSAPNNPPSKDCAARQTGGRFEGWDILSAAGVSGPRRLATYPPIYHDLTGQVPIPVLPVNHLGSQPPPDEPDEPDVPAPPALDELTRQVMQLREEVRAWKAELDECVRKVDALGRQVEAFKRYPLPRLRLVPEGPDPEAPAYSTSRSLGHAHNVRPTRYRVVVLPE